METMGHIISTSCFVLAGFTIGVVVGMHIADLLSRHRKMSSEKVPGLGSDQFHPMKSELRKPMLSDEAIDSWSENDDLHYGGRIARKFYERKIDSGELILRDELDVSISVCIKDGKHACCFVIGRDWFYNLITEAQYNEHIRRGAKIVEWNE